MGRWKRRTDRVLSIRVSDLHSFDGRIRLRAAFAASAAAATFALIAPAMASAITISPLPGTPDASPQTQISILGTAPGKIASVTVTGSESGPHGGSLQSYVGGQGASYVLSSPLAEGESVTVVVSLTEGSPVEDTFSVARLAPPQGKLEVSGEKPEEQEHFVSEPALHPPRVTVKTSTPGLAGDIFLDPLPAPIIHVGRKLLEFEPVGPNGLMILNPAGQLVWWHQFPKGSVGSNLELTQYEGKPALAWWQGSATEAAFGEGEGIIANTSYEILAHIPTGNGYKADIHELQITPQGTAYLEAYSPVCTPVCDEAHPPVVDSVVQEVDIKTGLVMWEWHALGAIPTSDTEVPPAGGVFDPYHLNSIQLLKGNNVLISLRDTSAIYDVAQSGSIAWVLGGKKNSFTMGKRAYFYFQHDARLEGNRLTMFDDEAGPPIHGISRGLVLRLNMATKHASVQHEYTRPEPTVTVAEGGVQQVPGGDVMVGFGSTPYFSEFSKSGGAHREGTLLFDASLPTGDGTYRVFRFPWSATPSTLPAAAAVRESPGQVAVYASWNGATSVAGWEVLAGEDPQSLAPVATAPRSGFETKIVLPTTATTFEVRALNGEGKPLATSAAVTAP